MKKLLALAIIGALCAACGGNNKIPEPDYSQEKEMKPGDSEHMPTSFLFDKDGYLKAEMQEAYQDDMPCLDTNKDGKGSRAEWDGFMEYWRTHTPEAGIGLCEQYKKETGK